jgi:hypothetical protein
MNPVSARLIIAGALIVFMGVAIALTGAGVGEYPVQKGAVVGMLGIGLIGSGLFRIRKPQD